MPPTWHGQGCSRPAHFVGVEAVVRVAADGRPQGKGANVNVMQFLSSLPALLGLTGFIVYYFLIRNRGGDKVTLDIVGKLRRDMPERLPAQPEKLDSATLAQLIEGDASLRAKVSDQDFQLLRDALRQQFTTSVVVYALCFAIFLVGVGLYVYASARPIPVSISSISAESLEPAAKGIAVDLDGLRVRWSAAGDPEDVAVCLEGMETHRRTDSRRVRSTESQVVFSPAEFRAILADRQHNGENRIRALFQTAKSLFVSSEFPLRVGTTILAVHIDPMRIKIIGMIDNTAIQNYNFEARLLVWASSHGGQPSPISYGGAIQYGHNDFTLDPTLKYDWSTVRLAFLGPDDPRVVRTQLLGF
jgi:hypothetical protein